jgi:hypothetical protein
METILIKKKSKLVLENQKKNKDTPALPISNTQCEWMTAGSKKMQNQKTEGSFNPSYISSWNQKKNRVLNRSPKSRIHLCNEAHLGTGRTFHGLE